MANSRGRDLLGRRWAVDLTAVGLGTGDDPEVALVVQLPGRPPGPPKMFALRLSELRALVKSGLLFEVAAEDGSREV